MSILCGDFFFETCQTSQAQHAFFNPMGHCVARFFFHLFWIDDGTLGFGRDCIYNSVGALWSFFTFLFLL